MKTLIGKKVGMTQIFDEKGNVIPVTVIEAGPCSVVQIKTVETDGYNAVQLGFGSVKENIRYGKPDATDEEIIEAAKSANAHEFIARQPDGYDSMLGERGIGLSGGERQRISIARAIIRNPDVIIFDEATSALDTVSEKEIQNAINNLTKRFTFSSLVGPYAYRRCCYPYLLKTCSPCSRNQTSAYCLAYRSGADCRQTVCCNSDR